MCDSSRICVLTLRLLSGFKSKGMTLLTLRDEGLHRLPNGEIFSKAISENRILLTFDLDFGEIVALSEGQRTSVILFRRHNTRTAHVIDRLNIVLKDSSEALEKGSIIVVEEGRHRIRYLYNWG